MLRSHLVRLAVRRARESPPHHTPHSVARTAPRAPNSRAAAHHHQQRVSEAGKSLCGCAAGAFSPPPRATVRPPTPPATTPSTPHPCQAPSRQRRHRHSVATRAAVAGEGPALGRLSADQKAQVNQYIDELMDWNTRMNITGAYTAAVRDRDEAMLRHVEDSLALLPVIEQAARAPLGAGGEQTRLRVVDVGSGGGLPGLLLAIARPEWDVTLLDTLKKRCDFVSAIISKIGVGNVTVLCDRAEDAGRDETQREKYDVSVARAVAEMRLLLEFCLPLVRVGGHLVAAKGPNPQDEIDLAQRSLGELQGTVKGIFPVESYGREGQQFSAVVVEKHGLCPAKYPRKPGTPKKRPL